MNPTRSLTVAALAGVGIVVLAGCGNGLSTSRTTLVASPSPHASSPSTTATSSSTPSGTSSGTPTTAGQPSASGSPHVALATCDLGSLKVALDSSEGGGAMGSLYLLLDFTNTSRSDCALRGHPGVSFVGKDAGTQIGAPAQRSGSLRLVRLAPGETTTAVLRIANAGDYSPSTCAPTTTDGLRVYPPGSYRSAFVPYRTQACQGDLTSTGSPQLSVSAVGTSDASAQ